MTYFSQKMCLALPCLAGVVAGIGTDFGPTGVRSDYTVWCTGICDKDKTSASTPGAVLMGGGTDTNEAFAWQIANAKGGDFLVMRASGDDAYNDYIYEMSIATDSRLNSVRTILFKNEKAAAASEVLDIIRNSEAIFFAGL